MFSTCQIQNVPKNLIWVKRILFDSIKCLYALDNFDSPKSTILKLATLLFYEIKSNMSIMYYS